MTEEIDKLLIYLTQKQIHADNNSMEKEDLKRYISAVHKLVEDNESMRRTLERTVDWR